MSHPLPSQQGLSQDRPGGLHPVWPPQVTSSRSLPGATARAQAAEDAGLLAALRQVARAPGFRIRLVLLAAGVTPITVLALALAGVASLRVLTLLLVAPAIAVAVGIGVRYPVWGRRALLGLAAGLVATACYDLLRLGGVWAGVWADPIPGIGTMLLGGQQVALGWQVLAGYGWRYLADGGALGTAYAAAPTLAPRSGLAFGAAVCAGLLLLLALAPQAQVAFLPLTWVTALGALAGHLVYGGVLGWLARRWLHPRPAAGIKLSATAPSRAPIAIDARAHTGPMAAASTSLRRANGPALAAILAAAVGWATLGLLVLAGEASPLLAVMLSYVPSGGPLTGSSTLAVLIGGLTWVNLHLRWAGRWLDPVRGLRVTLVLLAIGLASAIGCALGGCLAPLEAG